MNRLGRSGFRKKVIPTLAVAGVIVIITAAYAYGLQGPGQTFSFGVFWPTPTSYTPGYTPPNVYLGINYTGPGVRNFTFSIVSGTTVLASGMIPVAHDLPFKVLSIAPVPSVVQATVSVGGRTVFVQNITLL